MQEVATSEVSSASLVDDELMNDILAGLSFTWDLLSF